MDQYIILFTAYLYIILLTLLLQVLIKNALGNNVNNSFDIQHFNKSFSLDRRERRRRCKFYSKYFKKFGKGECNRNEAKDDLFKKTTTSLHKCSVFCDYLKITAIDFFIYVLYIVGSKAIYAHFKMMKKVKKVPKVLLRVFTCLRFFPKVEKV
jgi:hypothetical protein